MEELTRLNCKQSKMNPTRHKILRLQSRISALILLCSFLFSAFCQPIAAVDAYHSVDTGQMRVALTFDDGPHPRLTPRILEILDRYGIRATFFMIGKNVCDYPETARMVAAAGHEIGNHTDSHVRLYGLGRDRAERELDGCALKLQAECSYTPVLFRPPEGAVDSDVLAAAAQKGYRVILWSVDTRDWEVKNAGVIVNRVLSAVKPGDIILMHDFISYNSKTPEALERLIPKLLARGYEIGSVGELLNVSP